MDSGTIFLLCIFLTPFLGLLIYGIANRKRELTGSATVISHRMDLGVGGGWYGDNWNRMITFRLSDGTELELYAIQADYTAIADGQTGTLTWDKDILIHFDADNP